MVIPIKYKNAYTEVCTILDFLDEEEYEKIPSELLAAYEKNRNLEYEYKMNDELDLTKQPMLPETKAILFNIFRDYLASPKEKTKILQIQREERRIKEEEKKDRYSRKTFLDSKTIERKEISQNVEISKSLVDTSKEKGFWDKIRKFFNGRFKR